MKRTSYWIGAAVVIAFSSWASLADPVETRDTTPPGPTLVQQICSTYTNIGTLSCAVSKKTTSQQGTLLLLSRVTFKRPDRIHIENVAPASRRILADGERLYYHVTGTPRGFSRPIADLGERWLTSLRTVPGTALDHLILLKNLPEKQLPPTPEHPYRSVYQVEHLHVVLSCDGRRRLVRVEFFTDGDLSKRTASYDYSQFQKIADGCWIPCLHVAVLYSNGDEVTERRRITNLVVNQPVNELLFQADVFFKDVEFVDDFEEAYGLR